MSNAAILDALYEVVLSRKGADPARSHTAALYAKGRGKIAQKVGEEAVETVIEAVAGNRPAIISESADLLYHLSVLWADADIRPQEVYALLQERFGISGIDEKAARRKD
jgi:phosphoribosyl-ATP pyrophosphohydrolase